MAASCGTWEEDVVRWKRVGELGMEVALREIGCPEDRILEVLKRINRTYDFDPRFQWSSANLGCCTELERSTILATAGRGISRIKSVLLQDETETEATAFFVNLSSNTNIRSLSFCPTSVFFNCSKGCTLLRDALATNPAIRCFELSGVGMEGLSCLMNGLQLSNTLVILSLSRIPLVDEGVRSIAECLGSAKFAVEVLLLTDVNMDSEGARCLLKSLESCKTLRELNLSSNPLGDEGVSLVADFLANNKTLRELNLDGVGCYSKGAALLSLALVRNSSLKVLSFGILPGWRGGDSESFTDGYVNLDAAMAFTYIFDSQVTRKNFTLRELRLQWPPVPWNEDLMGNSICVKYLTSMVESLTEMIKTNRALRRLSLEGFNLPSEACTEQLLPALKENSTLRDLKLRGCKGLSRDVLIALMDSVKSSNVALNRISGAKLWNKMTEGNAELRNKGQKRSASSGIDEVSTTSGCSNDVPLVGQGAYMDQIMRELHQKQTHIAAVVSSDHLALSSSTKESLPDVIPKPIIEAPTTYKMVMPSIDNAKDTINFSTERPGEGQQSDNYRIPDAFAHLVEMAGCAPRSVGTQQFIRNIEEGGEDGYFVSSTWLLGLEERDRESLMSVLWRAGYSEMDVSTTRTLFARIEDTMQHQAKCNDISSVWTDHEVPPGDTKEVGRGKGDDGRRGLLDFHSTEGPVVDYSLHSPLGSASGSAAPSLISAESQVEVLIEDAEKQGEKSQAEYSGGISSHHGSRVFEKPVATSCLVPGWKKHKLNLEVTKQDKQLAILVDTEAARTRSGNVDGLLPWWKSLLVALKSTSQQSFCVSTQWLSNLNVDEKAELTLICSEIGYERIYETSTTTWYNRVDDVVEDPAIGDDPSDHEPSRAASTSFCGGAFGHNEPEKPGPSGSGCTQGKEESIEDFDNLAINSESYLANRMGTRESNCHPQHLSVACTSSHTPIELPRKPLRTKRQQFGDLVVTTPLREWSKEISTIIDKSFTMEMIEFPSDGRGQKVSINLNAIVRSSLKCCWLFESDLGFLKVRIKFSDIFGEVKKKETNEVLCNSMVLSSINTGLGMIVYGEEDSDEISLYPENGYPPAQKRYLNSQSSGTSDNLVWLAISEKIIDPGNAMPKSKTFELRGDVRKRRKMDLDSGIRRSHILHFQEVRPFVLEGETTLTHPTTSDLDMRYQLEISYLKPCAPLPGHPSIWTAQHMSKDLDFDCCLNFRTRNVQ